MAVRLFRCPLKDKAPLPVTSSTTIEKYRILHAATLGHRGFPSTILHHRYFSAFNLSQSFQQGRFLLLAWLWIKSWTYRDRLCKKWGRDLDSGRQNPLRPHFRKAILQDKGDSSYLNEDAEAYSSQKLRRQTYVLESGGIGLCTGRSSWEHEGKNIFIVR